MPILSPVAASVPAALAAGILLATSLSAQQVPRAIYTDPAHDPGHPARMVVLHIPTGEVKLNGVAYLAAGAGPHPTFVLLHGLPGNEKNLDLAQAVRRAGWNAITFNYRGSWGSPGVFRFARCLQDADAVLAYLRAPANANDLGIDTMRLVIAGHSMGGWVTAETAAHDHDLTGAVLISAFDPGAAVGASHDQLVKLMADNMESLAGVTAEAMADELAAHGKSWALQGAYEGLARTPLLVLTADDGLAAVGDSLAAGVRRRGNGRLTTLHLATDHSYSDRRVALESAVIRWLRALRR